ncbi:hypothetical protein GJ699_21600 [Duganella sp. FT80W]|uniref:Colicin D C-terminal domain-containing protein n=1 Tax=Duganella guangzhouensis TaxID=2666084 RepID=A0A6I2L8J4_9BURK|nr:hypothetical protein [Duganella guangzhouensis]
MNTGYRWMHFRMKRLQHTFRHARNFGVLGTSNKNTLAAFRRALLAHIASPHTTVLEGYYRNRPVTHFIDLRSGLNVMRGADGYYLSGWRLNERQFGCLLNSGRVGGAKS